MGRVSVSNTSVNLDNFLARIAEEINLEEAARPPRETAQAVLDRFFSSEVQARCRPCGEPASNLSTCTKIDTSTNPTIAVHMVSRFIADDIEALSREIV
jgi:hypothetical protein